MGDENMRDTVRKEAAAKGYKGLHENSIDEVPELCQYHCRGRVQ